MEHTLQSGYPQFDSQINSLSKNAIAWYKNTNGFYRFIYKNFIDSDITSKMLALCCRELVTDIDNINAHLSKFKRDCQIVIENALNNSSADPKHTLTITQRLQTKQLMAEVNIAKDVAYIFTKLEGNSRYASKDEQETLQYIKRDVKLKLNAEMRRLKREIQSLGRMFTALALNNCALNNN